MTIFPDLERRLHGAAGGASAAPRRGVRGKLVVSLAATSVLVVILVVALSTGRGAPDLAARAYAAASAPGIVHWRTDIAGEANDGRVVTRQRVEGWTLGAVTHVLRSDVVHGSAHVTSDERTVGRRTRSWISASDDYLTTTRAEGRQPVEPIPSGDPFVAFRRAFRAHELRDLGAGRFEVPFPHLPAGSVVYEVDQRSGRPVRLVIRNDQPARFGRPATHGRTVVTFTAYETLGATAKNRGLLALLSHPGAGPGRDVAADHFAVLRSGVAPTGDAGERLRMLARNLRRFRIDPTGIRALAADVWLLPGRGYVCLAQANGAGIGAGCTTTHKAFQNGIGVADPTRTLVAVPDGVVAIEAHKYGHPGSRRYRAPGGLVRLPGMGYQQRLVRR